MASLTQILTLCSRMKAKLAFLDSIAIDMVKAQQFTRRSQILLTLNNINIQPIIWVRTGFVEN